MAIWRSQWTKDLRASIARGEQWCRNPKCGFVQGPGNPLTLDHILPRSLGGTGRKDNVTILCRGCNELKADLYWPWLYSLADEEVLGLVSERQHEALTYRPFESLLDTTKPPGLGGSAS